MAGAGMGCDYSVFDSWRITTTDPMLMEQAPFWGVVFGIFWGLPVGALIEA
jgi:hypothetical protein